MNADGTRPIQLTTNASEDREPAWSVDGKKIVFASNRDGNFEIYVLTVFTTVQTRLTNNPAHDCCPAWVLSPAP